MSVRWTKDPAILARLERVSDLHLMGATNVEISRTLGVDEGTVRNDLKRLQSLWLERVGDTQAERKARAVAVYRRVQRAAWLEFGAARDTSLNKSAYLNTIRSAEESIGKVLGTEAPLKLAGADGGALPTLVIQMVPQRALTSGREGD